MGAPVGDRRAPSTNDASPRTLGASMQADSRTALISILPATLLALSLTASATAQSHARPGIEVQITTITSSGGSSRRAFILLPPSRTTTTAGPSCARYETLGRAASGPVREVRLRIEAVAGDQTLSFGEGCGTLHLEVVLDDGRVLIPTVGSATLTLGPTDLHGDLTSTLDEDGVPTTLVARLALRLP
jgi:hypothetical protein